MMRKLAMTALLVAGMTAAAAAEDRYLIDDAGLHFGNGVVIDQRTEANKDALGRLLKGYRVEIEEYWGEGSRYFRYVLRDGNEVAFRIDPGVEMEPGDGRDQLVGEIQVYTRKVADRHGIRPGDTFGKLRATGKVECGLNAEAGDLFLCERAGERLQYVFRNPQAGSADAGRPDDIDRILYIRWYAPHEPE